MSSILLQIAKYQITGVDPTSKLVLMMIADSVDKQGLQQGSVASWSSTLALSERELAPSLRTLAKLALLDAVTLPSGGQGRPRIEYACSPAHLDKVGGAAEGAVAYGHLEGLIRSLVTGAGAYVRQPAPRKGEDGKLVAPASRKGAGAKLNVGNRLVLVTLISFADQAGVVRGRGGSELAAVAGMSAPRWETHIAKLLALGYIRVYVPGASGAPLVGVAAGLYFLNLGHPGYGTEAMPSLAYGLASGAVPLEYADRGSGDLRRLITDARVCASRPSEAAFHSTFATYFDRLPATAPELVYRLASVLALAGRQGLARYLQCLLEVHTSAVLTEYVEVPRIAHLDAVQRQVSERILADIYPARRRERKADDAETLAAIELLARYLAMRAVEIADHCQQEIRGFDLYGAHLTYQSRKPITLLILPWVPTTRSGYLIVVATYERLATTRNDSFFVRQISRRRIQKGDKFSCESEFNTEQVQSAPFSEGMYALGLFSRPSAKAKHVLPKVAKVSGVAKPSRRGIKPLAGRGANSPG